MWRCEARAVKAGGPRMSELRKEKQGAEGERVLEAPWGRQAAQAWYERGRARVHAQRRGGR